MHSDRTDRRLAVSPISSPAREKRTSFRDASEEEEEEVQDTDSDESVSVLSPPPAYLREDGSSSHRSLSSRPGPSSHRGEEGTKKSTAAYENLMSFLDDASASLPKSPRKNNSSIPPLDIEITRHHEDMRDDLSSMSYSVSSSMQGSKAFTSNKYIWNELDDADADGDAVSQGGRSHRYDDEGSRRGTDTRAHSQHSSSSSYRDRDSDSTHTFFRVPPSYSSNQSTSSQHTKSTLQSNVEEIQEKVNNMKQELRKKTQRMKDLQTELTRLKAVKDRKRTKLTERHAKELSELTSNNAQAIQKQKEFVDKIQEAVATLKTKAEHLEEKVESNGQTLAAAVDKAKSDGVRSIRRAQRQWEADEKTLFEKLCQNKRESMQKAANDHIAPRLEKLVKANQEQLMKKREEGEKELVQRTAEYKAALQSDFEQSLSALRERYSVDESGSHVTRTRKIEEVKLRHESEIKALKARFAQDQRMLEESSDRTRRLDSDSHLASMTSLRQMEQKALEDWMRKQQREINSALQEHEQGLREVEKELREEYEQWVRQQDDQEAKVQSHRLEKKRGELILAAKSELETVRSRLRAEAASEREQRSRQAEQELKDLRLEIQEKLQSQYDADQRSASLATSLHTEVERLQDRLFQHRSSVTELRAVVDEEARRSRLVAVENNIDGVKFEENSKRRSDHSDDGDGEESKNGSADFSVIESAVISLKTRLNEELSRLEADGNRSIREAENTLEKTRKQKAAQDMAHYKALTARKAELGDDFARVEDKISQLLSRKNRAIADMRKTLQELQTKNREFEQELDEFRNKKIGSG